MTGTARLMNGVGRLSKRVGLVAALFALAGSGAVAIAASGTGAPDPSFGTSGRVVVPLPDAFAKGRFGPIAAAANGRFLVAYVGNPDVGPGDDEIERIEADGAPDPSFGDGGSVTVPYEVNALAEDAGGGVVFGDDGAVERLGPDGTPDKAFDQRVGYFGGGFRAKTIVVDSAGRILIGGHYMPGARYYAEESDAAIIRLAPNGEPDPSFGKKGIAYVTAIDNSNEGEFGLLPDGSTLMVGPSLTHIGAEGTVLAGPKVDLGEGSNSIVVLPDGGFAVASFAREGLEPKEGKPGCTVSRYGPDGSLDPAFAQGGVFKAPSLAGCRLLATPDGGLLVWGTTEVASGARAPQLIRLTAAGAPSTGFGNGGTVTLRVATESGNELSAIGGAALGADGRIVLAGGARDAILAGLEATGAPDTAFGDAGTVVKSRPLPSTTSVRTVLAEPGGGLIVAATTNSGGSERHPIWMRFTAAGELKRTAAGSPYLAVPSVGFQLLPDGRNDLFSIGYSELPTYGPTVTKYTRAGAVVNGFAADGVAPLPATFKPSSAVVDRGGGVTVLGSLNGAREMAAYRLTAGGSPDRRFGRGGLAAVRFGGAKGGRAYSGLALPGGGVLLVGRSGGRLALAELGPGGRLRQGFGHGGKLVCGCDGRPPATTKVVADHGAFYVLSGWELGRSEAASVLVAVTHAGTIGRAFGDHGHRATDASGPVALLARGRQLIVVGTRGFGTTPAVVRAFGLGGAPRRSFESGATVSAGPLRGQELAATLQPNGRLILVGERPAEGAEGGEEPGSSLELLGLR